jgi:hypothetical protein
MHEIRATVAPEHVAETTRLAHAVGIERITVMDVYVNEPGVRRQVLSVETSTPKARAFVEALLASPGLSQAEYSLTSRELRAIVDGSELGDLTRPISEPFPDVIQDLWQLSHITPSYLGRAAAGGILLATGIMDDSAVAIVVAALFLPFLAEVLAVSLGIWSRDRRLIVRGLGALTVSTVLAFMGGVIVAWLSGGPIRFAGFKAPLPSFALSALIGVTAGLSTADDTGRRYLIGVAAAVQLAIFPAWLGAGLVTGLPPRAVLTQRLISFLINVATISGAALASYAALNLGRGAGSRTHRGQLR